MQSSAGSGYIENIVHRYSDTIVRVAFQYVKTRADAEDIMQEVFVALIKQPPFSGHEHLKAWLIRVTVNKCKNHLKKLKRRNETQLADAENSLTEEQQSVLDELEQLPPKDRAVIYLYYFEGYKTREVAKLLGMREKAAAMRLSRARSKLKELLEEGQ